jgi:phospholipid/cholesterol/gamma-HCH transport system substrate-binding protein
MFPWALEAEMIKMKKNKREINVEVLVGLFVSGALLALGIFTIVLGGTTLFKTHYQIEVLFDEIGGLQEGDGVYMRGKQIGYVKQTLLEPKDVRVVLTLDEPVVFRNDYRIEVMSASMLGGKYLRLDLGHPASNLLPEGAKLLGESPVDVMANFNMAVDSMQQMLAAVGAGEGTLGRLLSDDTLYKQVLELNQGLLGFMGKIKSADGTFNRLISDPSVYVQTEQLLGRLNHVVGQIEQGEGLLGQLLNEKSTTIDDMEFAVAELATLMAQLNSTNGTIGKLINDPALYEESTELVGEARATMDDLRETSPLRSFGSVIFGAF